jgi:hypothetical protein
LTDQGLDLIARQRVIKAICQMIHKRCKNWIEWKQKNN